MLCISEKLVHKERILLFTMQSILQPILRSQASIQLFCFDCNVLFVEKIQKYYPRRHTLHIKLINVTKLKYHTGKLQRKWNSFPKCLQGATDFLIPINQGWIAFWKAFFFKLLGSMMKSCGLCYLSSQIRWSTSL